MSAVDLNFFPNLTSCKIGKMTEVREDGEESTESRTDFSACFNLIGLLYFYLLLFTSYQLPTNYISHPLTKH
ncbi:MAG: hypothetical protein F6K50_12230 [Moorea sp. SIO3I7]|nr:hypothetical protein [Moorena sp. SIO3I7]